VTTESLYRVRCDAPRCEASTFADKVTDTPDGWQTLKSTEHIPYVKTSVYPARRARSNALSYGERCRGSFSLHLCPQHPGAFDAHLPRTDGLYTRPGKDGMAAVSCGCGASFGYTGTGWRVAGADMSGPSAHTEKAWWAHLPADLRWYAERDQEVMS
jgi:hypothetical protein